jgi:CBS domain-containing protein
MEGIKYWTESVVTVSGEDSVRSAAKCMHLRNVSSLLILDDKKPAGIITERDVVAVVAKDMSTDTTRVADVMSRNLVTVNIKENLGEAQARMLEHKFGHILVVNDDGNLVGVASLSDLNRIWRNKERIHVLRFTE